VSSKFDQKQNKKQKKQNKTKNKQNITKKGKNTDWRANLQVEFGFMRAFVSH
jgi:hypothetical protein